MRTGDALRWWDLELNYHQKILMTTPPLLLKQIVFNFFVLFLSLQYIPVEMNSSIIVF